MEEQLVASAACLAALVAAFGVALLFSRAGFPVPAEGRRIGRIDGLRSLLALFVLCGHGLIWVDVVYGDGRWRGANVVMFGSLGGLSVPMFFMITGMLFYGRALKGFPRIDWASLYISRVFRILPLVTVSFLAVSLIVAVRFGIPEAPAGPGFPAAAVRWIFAIDEPPIFGHADSGLVNAYVLWSLTYEWLFYVALLPLMSVAMVFLSASPRRWLLPAAMFLALIVLRHLSDSGCIYLMPLFVVGMLAHEVLARDQLKRLAASRPCAALGCACILAAALVGGDASTTTKMVLTGVFFVTVACGNSLFGLLASKPALILGEASFSIYVLHGIVLYCVFASGLTHHLDRRGAYLLIPLSSAIVAFVSACSYLLIERRFVEVGKSVSRRCAAMRLRHWQFP